MSIFAVESGTIDGPRGRVLENLNFTLPVGVTVMVGPSGAGKSALLRALAMQPPAPGWRVHGRWGRSEEVGAVRLTSIRWLPQERYRAPHAQESFSRPPAVASWREAFARQEGFILLDEPLRGIPEGDEEEIVQHLREHASRGGCAVVITHNLKFARALADHVLLICAHEVQALCSAQEFFEAPPNELAAQMVRAGNCSVAATQPKLPSHFRWIIQDRLAGMGKPGLLGDVEDELTAVANAGVSLLVSLTEQPFDVQKLRSYGIQSRHLSIRDMHVPAIGKAASVCSHIESVLDGGKAVALHCRAGLGRTGTMLAAMLVWRGMSAEMAIESVRRVCPHYIQRPSQVRFVHQFADHHG